MEEKAKIKHLETKFSIARYELIIACEPHELYFYLYLKLYAINKSSAFPSQETIENDLNWTEDQVRYWVKKMANKGRLKYIPGSGRKASLYDIIWYDRVNLRGGKIPVPGKFQSQRLEKSNLRGRKIPTPTINNITNRNITKDCEASASPSSILIKKKNQEITELFDYYKQEFKKMTGKTPIFNWGKCVKLAKPHLETLGLKTMKHLVYCYLYETKGEDRKFFKENVWGLSCFLSANIINKINLKYYESN